MSIIWCIIGGLFAGIIAGMGMGGGSILIPILTLLASVSQHAAQSANMLAFLPAAIIAIVIHKKAGRIDFSVCLPIVLYGFVFSLIGAALAIWIRGEILRKLFAVFLIILCLSQIKRKKG